MNPMTDERINQIKMLVNFHNITAGTRYRQSNKELQRAVNGAIEAANGDIRELKVYIKKSISEGITNIYEICNEFADAHETPAPKPETPQAVDNLTASMNFMGQVVMELLAKTKLEEIRDTVSASIKDELTSYILNTYGPIKRKIEFQLPDRKVELQGVLHSKFDTVLKFVQANEPVFLTGPAGSGKNVLCQQIAKTLGLNFYFSNAVTQEYKITGFTDANGTFHESQFYKAFKNGGVFMLDEMDASIPEVLIILNAAIANRYFDFPAPIGYTEAHENFRVIAAGNTFGNGADYDYVGRNQLDAASLDRFAMVRIDYDERIEESCANGDSELLNFCRAFRTATQTAGIRTVISYRAISRMAKLSAMLEPKEILDTCLIKSLEVDDLNAIKDKLAGCGRWSVAFSNVLHDRKEMQK